MNYDNELILLKKSFIMDSIGNQIENITETKILCKVKSVSGNEFYKASQSNLKPEKIFIIHSFEYDDETEVIFCDKNYSVIRSYVISSDEIELVCERKVKNV